MSPFSFIHAADLHLDAPFRGISTALSAPSQGADEYRRRTLLSLFNDAGFVALHRIVTLCLEAKVNFLLLAGDVYNVAHSSLRARLALRDAFLRLEKANISVFMVHGNHDPLNENAPSIPWPANVTVFGPQVESHFAYRTGKSGEVIARIHGMSHTSDKEERNLVRLFSRSVPQKDDADVFQIGLLHCALDGQCGVHSNYAPCTLADLAAAHLDYWALGHVHAAHILGQHKAARHPYIVYPGSSQGMHVNESGSHGCMLVRVDAHGTATPTQIPLAPVQWESVSIPIDNMHSIPELESLVLEHLDALAANAEANTRTALEIANLPSTSWPPPALVTRVTLTGRTALDHELRRPGTAKDLQHHLEEELRGVWIRDIAIAVRPQTDIAAIAERTDLTGEIVRTTAALLNSPEALEEIRAQTLGELFQRPRLRKLLSQPDDAELAALAEEAQLLCLELLEGE